MNDLLAFVTIVGLGLVIGYGTKKALQALDWFLAQRRT
jgi:hypothetical protein